MRNIKISLYILGKRGKSASAPGPEKCITLLLE